MWKDESQDWDQNWELLDLWLLRTLSTQGEIEIMGLQVELSCEWDWWYLRIPCLHFGDRIRNSSFVGWLLREHQRCFGNNCCYLQCCNLQCFHMLLWVQCVRNSQHFVQARMQLQRPPCSQKRSLFCWLLSCVPILGNSKVELMQVVKHGNIDFRYSAK